MRDAWSHGRNFDPALLEFFTADPGFIIGESLIGVDPLGGAGDDTVLDATFTSLQISSPTTVEAGLFVHREVETCQLSATLPEAVDLDRRWIVITYNAGEIYRGRIVNPTLTEAVEVDAQYKPGNTATKTYRVTLTATNSEDTLAGRTARASAFVGETFAQRIAYWTGLTPTVLGPAVDLPVWWQNAGWDTGYVRRLTFLTDSPQSLLDALRDEARLRNMTVIYQPFKTPQFVLKPNNQWLVGELEDEALTFSDDPDHVVGQTSDPDDTYLHEGRYVGFTTRQVGKDPSLFVNGVTVRWGQYDVESPPANGPVDTRYTYRASGANQSDTLVDLGTLDVATVNSFPYYLSRAVTQVLPLRASVDRFTKQIETPLQSTQQLQGTVPGMALLEVDGELERVAVLSRTHTVTPEKWLVSYTLGPPHLLDRSSDFDPGGAEVHTPTGGPGPGTPTVLEWVVPDYPSDMTIYEMVYAINSSLGQVLITSDNALLASYGPGQSVAQPPGTVRQISLFGHSSPPPYDNYYVLYTSNPSPGSVNPSPLWREGAPAFLGDLL